LDLAPRVGSDTGALLAEVLEQAAAGAVGPILAGEEAMAEAWDGAAASHTLKQGRSDFPKQ